MQERRITVSPRLAEILGIGPQVDRATVAQALARAANLPSPKRAATQEVLAAIVEAVQRDVIDDPDVPMDRAIVADTALSRGCLAAGGDATRELFDELGSDSLDKPVRHALATTIASGLADRGLIRLIGG